MRDRMDTAGLAPVTGEGTPEMAAKGRGAQIRRRREALGLSTYEFAERAGMSRTTLGKIEDDDETVKESKYRDAERALDSVEYEVSGPYDRANEGDELVEYRLTGDFGVSLIVKGPISQRGELEASVARLLREMRSSQ